MTEPGAFCLCVRVIIGATDRDLLYNVIAKHGDGRNKGALYDTVQNSLSRKALAELDRQYKDRGENCHRPQNVRDRSY